MDIDVRLLANRARWTAVPAPAWLKASCGGYSSPEADKGDGSDVSTADKAKGRIKEGIGNLIGDDELRKEGQAQQHKGHHLAQTAEAHAVAEKHEREAELFEHEERYRQGT